MKHVEYRCRVLSEGVVSLPVSVCVGCVSCSAEESVHSRRSRLVPSALQPAEPAAEGEAQRTGTYTSSLQTHSSLRGGQTMNSLTSPLEKRHSTSVSCYACQEGQLTKLKSSAPSPYHFSADEAWHICALDKKAEGLYVRKDDI